MKNLILTATILILGGYSFAQTLNSAKANSEREAGAALSQKNAALAATVSPLATSTCSYNFISGTGDTFLKYCVTVNGNITQLEAPAGHEHIAVGAFGEGYEVCDLNTHPSVGYFDYADFGGSSNWGPATLLTQTATAVKIARTTSDGNWTLTQTIALVAGTSSINITMVLRNNSTVDRRASLLRYADVDADSTFLNSFDATTVKSAFGWRASEFGFANAGLLMQNVGVSPFAHSAVAHNFPSGPSCTQPATPGTETLTDGSIVMLYFLETVPKGRTATVTVRYQGL
jgi:hypothetical protein